MKNFKNRFKSSKPKTRRISKPYPNSIKSINEKSIQQNIDKIPSINNDVVDQNPINKQTQVHTHAKSDQPSVIVKQSKLNIKLSKRINIYLVIFIILYIIIEISFNYLLVSQMTHSATALDILNIERIGRIVTGIGIALLMCKSLLNHAHFKFKFFVKCFVGFLVLGIFISYYLQVAIINYVVRHATPEDQQRALLVSAAATTLVPFYDDESATNYITVSERILLPFYQAVSSESTYLPIETKYQRLEHFNNTSRACSKQTEYIYANHYPMANPLNKAFFSYSHLIASDTSENLHKQAILKYYSCIFNDKVLVGMYTDNLQIIKDKISEFYKEYAESSKTYNSNLKSNPNNKERIDNIWQSRISDKLGFEATLPPNLSFEAFVKHPDVKTYMTKNQTFKMPYPYSDDMTTELKNSLPDFILVNYLMAKENGIHDDELELKDKDASDSDDEKAANQFTKLAKFFEKPLLTTGKKSYKAVVMPMIALGFSVTFLVLNFISMISLIISDNSKKLSTWFQRIATVVFFILPFVISPTTPLTMPQSNSIFLEIVIKFLYFYQNFVWMIQQAVLSII